MVHESHELYKPEDFTSEEINRGDYLTVLVIDGDLAICKKCGKVEIELMDECPNTILRLRNEKV